MNTPDTPAAPSVPTRVWDLPVRLFHWALVLLMVALATTGYLKGEWMTWHMRCGYALLSLVFFRILWGFAGSTHARFISFLAGPGKAIQFTKKLLARAPAHSAGHNPLGGWMVLVLLLALLFQVGTGLFANDDILFEGPLAALVSKAWSDRLTGWHYWNVNLLWVLVGTHVAAVLYHWLVMKEDLVAAMFSGVKRLPEEQARGAAGRFTSSWVALVLLALSAIAVYLIVQRPF